MRNNAHKEERPRSGDGGYTQQELDGGAAEGDSTEGGEGEVGQKGQKGQKASEASGVYFIVTADEKFVKIGFSISVVDRVKQIKTIGPGTKDAKVIGYLPGTSATERWLHGCFGVYRDVGEWFHYTEEIRNFAASLMPVPTRASRSLYEPGSRRALSFTARTKAALVAAAKKPRKHRPRTAFTPEEVEAFFQACTSARDTAIFRIMYHRGLRSSEVGLLQLSDWDQARGKIHVSRVKHSFSGDYALSTVEQSVLREHLRARGDWPGPLFPGIQKKGISRKTIWLLMQKYCRLAGLDPDKAHPHTWKDTCGSKLAEEGADVMEIQDALGLVNVQNGMVYMNGSNISRARLATKTKDWK